MQKDAAENNQLPPGECYQQSFRMDAGCYNKTVKQFSINNRYTYLLQGRDIAIARNRQLKNCASIFVHMRGSQSNEINNEFWFTFKYITDVKCWASHEQTSLQAEKHVQPLVHLHSTDWFINIFQLCRQFLVTFCGLKLRFIHNHFK